MKPPAKALLVAAVLCAFLAAGAAPALAAKTVVKTIGGTAGTLGAEFNSPRGIAVNQTGAGSVPAGTFYVVDSTNARVQQFGPTGAFVRAWGYGVRDGSAEFQTCTSAANCAKGTASNGAGALNVPVGVAVDQGNGNVYVTSQTGRRVNAFSPTGVFFGAFGWGATNGAAELQFCTTLTGCGGPGATAPTVGNVGGGQFGAQIGNVAVAANGDVYVADKTSRRVQVFKPTLTGSVVSGVEFLRAFGWGVATGAAEFQVCTTPVCVAPAAAGTGLGQFGTNSPAEIALDPAGNLYALDNGNKRVQKFSPAAEPLTASFGAAAITANFGTGTVQNLAVAPDSGNVLVGAARAAQANQMAILELDSSGAEVELQGADLTIGTSLVGSGMAVADEALGGNVYMSSSSGGARVFVLNEPPTIAAATGVGTGEATLNGEVVSNEIETTYHFELTTDGVTWTKTPVPDALAGSGPGTIPVSHTATGLLPGTTYTARLVATRAAGGGSTTSGTVQFTTANAAPTIEATFASRVGAEGATLAAYLNPEGMATTYQFEYGTSTAYGQTVPVAPASAGKGFARVSVAQAIANLAPGTTYHFRVIATNATGTTSGPDASFTTLPAAPGIGGRAYEMVSPPDKHGSDVIVVYPEYTGLYGGANYSPIAAVDGDALAFTSFGSFANAPSHGVFSNYIANRSANGWTTTNLSVPMDGAQTSSPAAFAQGFTPDLSSHALIGPRFPQLTPDASEGVSNAYYQVPGTRSYELMTPGAPAQSFMVPEYVASSTDLRKSYLNVYKGGPLTPETPEAVFDSDTLYLWDAASGELSYVGIEPGGSSAFTDEIEIASPFSQGYNSVPQIWNPVSDDGSVAYFRLQTSQQLYVRVDDSETFHVSASQATTPDPVEQPPTYHWASADGGTVFFSSAEQLTDDANTGPGREGRDLYRWELGGEQLTDITVDTTDPNGAEVQGVIGGSEAGDRLYFVARGALAPGAVAGEENLYLWTDDGTASGSIEFISEGVGKENWYPLQSLEYRHMGRVTPDGSQVLFQSTEQLLDYDNDGTYQAYVYNADRDELVCASCNPSGKPASSDALAFGASEAVALSRTMTDDGRFVFFNTEEALVPDDVNGLGDAYAYDTVAGTTSLVSPGTGPFSAQFLDSSTDGSDIFFGTREQLVRIDTDENLDAYDARVGGGIASQNPPLVAPCVGEACRPAGAPPPPPPPSGSSLVNGPGNEPQKKSNGKKKQNKKKSNKSKKKSKSKKKQNKKKGKNNRAKHDRGAGR